MHNLDRLVGDGGSSSLKKGPQATEVSEWGRSGALLAMGCLQRTAQERVVETARARARLSGNTASDTDIAHFTSTPTTIMLTRLLPHLAVSPIETESLEVRAFALHSFGLLLLYSDVLGDESQHGTSVYSLDEQRQVLTKAVEIVEHNFFAAWTSTSEIDAKRKEVRSSSSSSI